MAKITKRKLKLYYRSHKFPNKPIILEFKGTKRIFNNYAKVIDYDFSDSKCPELILNSPLQFMDDDINEQWSFENNEHPLVSLGMVQRFECKWLKDFTVRDYLGNVLYLSELKKGDAEMFYNMMKEMKTVLYVTPKSFKDRLFKDWCGTFFDAHVTDINICKNCRLKPCWKYLRSMIWGPITCQQLEFDLVQRGDIYNVQKQILMEDLYLDK